MFQNAEYVRVNGRGAMVIMSDLRSGLVQVEWCGAYASFDAREWVSVTDVERVPQEADPYFRRQNRRHVDVEDVLQTTPL